MSDEVKAGFWKAYGANFLLDEARLRKLVQTLEHARTTLGAETQLQYRVYRRDRTFFHAYTLDDVLADDNVFNKRIVRVVIEVTPLSGPNLFDRLVVIDFDTNDAQSRSEDPFDVKFDDYRILMTVRAPSRDWTLILAEDLDAQISRSLTSRRFSFLAGHGPNVVFAVMCLAFAVFLMSLASDSQPVSAEAIAAMSADEIMRAILLRQTKASEGLGVTLVAGVVTVGVTIAIIEARVVSRIYELFDRSAFYWGDGKSDYDRSRARAQRWAWGVVVAFFVSLVASVVVAWFTR